MYQARVVFPNRHVLEEIRRIERPGIREYGRGSLETLFRDFFTDMERKLFDCGNPNFISKFETLTAWLYINDQEFYENTSPRFRMIKALEDITDTFFRLCELEDKRPSLDEIYNCLSFSYQNNKPLLDEVGRLITVLKELKPSKEDIETHKKEYPYWDEFVVLLIIGRDLGNVLEYKTLDKVEKMVNKIKDEIRYV